MKVLAQTRNRLTMKHFPISNWWTGGFLITCGLCFLIYLVFFTAVSASLSCQRISKSGSNCELKYYYLIGKTQKQKIFDLQEARIKTIVGSKGSRSYQVVISTPFGEYNLLSATGSYQKNEQISTQINNFIYSQQTYLSVRQHLWQESSIYLIIISTFIISGIFLVSYPIVICTFYKSLNKVVIEYQGLRGSKVKEYPLGNILRIDSQEKNTRYGRVYRPALVLRSQETIPIHQDYTNEKSNSNIIYSINTFLSSQK
ncbi:hypothetical protein [Anabaena subtropica]|uniref:Uncharacterized protein n=1 Tax=Anabaena subtropica FACHB-260 TaxID=2692884 RepID=A0ABR8CK73_9NOST|nr:hypothetical protein [Anabaena subtropica]MBD2343264.1 hypothetical protein [Anabaena subtropica FACHB-260]